MKPIRSKKDLPLYGTVPSNIDVPLQYRQHKISTYKYKLVDLDFFKKNVRTFEAMKIFVRVLEIRNSWTEITEYGGAGTLLHCIHVPQKVKMLKVKITIAVKKIKKEIQAAVVEITGFSLCKNT
jgi:hypothetical protein